MASYTGTVAVGSDDYDVDDTTTATTATTITARRVRDGGAVLTTNRSAYVDIDTSDMEAEWSISSASLRWYTESNTKSPKGDPFGSAIFMMNDEDTFVTIDSVAVIRSAGWDSIALTAEEIGWINRAGYTRFNFQVSNSDTASSIRAWEIRAREYIAGYSAYLNVVYTIPVEGTRKHRAIIIG